jgi:uncharacterized protein (TIGR03086 family)
MDTLDLLDAGFASTGRIVTKVSSDQLSAATPCRDWDVRALLNHMTGVVARFNAAAARTPDGADQREDFVGDDPSAIFADISGSTLTAWSRPGALEGTCVIAVGEIPAQMAAGINFIDTLVHGWDLAKALHLDATLDPSLATAALEISRSVIQDSFRGPGNGFGYPVLVPDGASPTDQLVAFMGRQP